MIYLNIYERTLQFCVGIEEVPASPLSKAQIFLYGYNESEFSTANSIIN